MGNNFSVYGEVRLEISKKIYSESEEQSIVDAYELLNELNVDIQEIIFKTDQGEVTVKVHDVNCLSWEKSFSEN